RAGKGDVRQARRADGGRTPGRLYAADQSEEVGRPRRFELTIRLTKKAPGLRRGLWFCSRIRCLSPYRNAGLSIQRAKLIDPNAFGGGRDYQFHPDGIRTLEIR